MIMHIILSGDTLFLDSVRILPNILKLLSTELVPTSKHRHISTRFLKFRPTFKSLLFNILVQNMFSFSLVRLSYCIRDLSLINKSLHSETTCLRYSWSWPIKVFPIVSISGEVVNQCGHRVDKLYWYISVIHSSSSSLRRDPKRLKLMGFMIYYVSRSTWQMRNGCPTARSRPGKEGRSERTSSIVVIGHFTKFMRWLRPRPLLHKSNIALQCIPLIRATDIRPAWLCGQFPGGPYWSRV